jgi:hypothetical protein
LEELRLRLSKLTFSFNSLGTRALVFEKENPEGRADERKDKQRRRRQGSKQCATMSVSLSSVQQR